MTTKHKTYFNWSSGKDASLALYYLQQSGKYNVDLLLTSINSYHNRISMHGVRRELLKQQANSIGLPLATIELPEEPSMEEYKNEVTKVVQQLQKDGYTCSGFGDIFLEDLKNYREMQLSPFGIECSFPLWKKDTKKLIAEFINLGFKAIVVCINANLLDESFVGRVIDESFIDDLPDHVDPCGENGEFHTFCFDGPIFKQRIEFTIGEKVYREYKAPDQSDSDKGKIGFWFCDLLPGKCD